MTDIKLQASIFNDIGLRDGVQAVVTCVPFRTGPVNVLAGDDLTLPHPVRFQLPKTGGVIDLPSNDATTWAWQIAVRYGPYSSVRLVSVPESATPIDFGDLVDVDPTTLSPEDNVNAWDVALRTIPESFHIVGDDLWMTRRDDSSSKIGDVRGRPGKDSVVPGPPGKDSTVPGPTGPAGRIAGATAKGLPAGSQPTVEAGGTPVARTFEFGIPKGDKGDKGADSTVPGPAGTITGATATGLAAGATPTVSLGGTPSERTLAFGIPKGDKGDKGDVGPASTVPGPAGTPAQSAADVPWITLTLTAGTGSLRYKVVNGLVEVRWNGSVSIASDSVVDLTASGAIPASARPDRNIRGSAALNAKAGCVLFVSSAGQVGLINSSGAARTAGEGSALYFL